MPCILADPHLGSARLPDAQGRRRHRGGRHRSKRFTGLVGVDASVSNAAILGLEGGYVTNHLNDNQFGDTVSGKGWQVGAYAVYDPGSFFLKGVTTYSSLNGDATRHINFTGLGTGTSFAANPTGSPDAKMWTFGLHGGARVSMSASSVLTPYLDYDYVNAKLNGFSEDNGAAAALTLDSAKSNHSYLTGGVKWATQIGGMVPELNLGYRYRFGDQLRASTASSPRIRRTTSTSSLRARSGARSWPGSASAARSARLTSGSATRASSTAT